MAAKIEWELDGSTVRVYRADTDEVIAEAEIVKDINGFRSVRENAHGFIVDRPQFAAAKAAAEHFAALVAMES